ncbi:MAG TPA: cytochrome c3 family protein [Methylomirabilota bacterium]|nr:cytochrome c3 family protein [Methylomirabilota bacterium]
MSDVFPKWTNKLPGRILVAAVLIGAAVIVGANYYLTPEYARVGYQPTQPVNFSHAIHVEELGLDCRYCHNNVDKSWFSNIPSTTTCMNCHNQVLAQDPRLAPVRESMETGKPIEWVQIHRTPDFVYFNHSVHVNRGISCVHCHGQVNKMDEVRHEKSFSMAFCLECHRDPAKNIRPLEEVYNLDWTPPANFAKEQGAKMVHDWKVESLQNCSACHR